MSEVGTNYLQEALEHAKRFITQEAETEIIEAKDSGATSIIRLANGLISIASHDLWAEMRSSRINNAGLHDMATKIALYATALVYELDRGELPIKSL
jgi:hypothetical protein